MITVAVNIDDNVIEKVYNLLQPGELDKLLRSAATAQQSEMHNRIHQRGEDSSENQIGTYSADYMQVRTGKKPAPDGRRYNRGGSTQVILSLSRQMENALTVVDTSTGWGVGYQDAYNYKKAQDLETLRYRKPIFLQSKTDAEKVNITIQEFIANALR